MSVFGVVVGECDEGGWEVVLELDWGLVLDGECGHFLVSCVSFSSR